MAEPVVDVAVVGSVNVDLSIPVARLPGPGETVLGGDVLRGGGGKGANQAVAAARLGAEVAMVGRVGDDDAGIWLRNLLDVEGIDTRALLATPNVPSGLAVIAVDDAGENSIVVSPGANGRVTEADLDAAGEVLAGAAVVIAQLEIPAATVAALPDRLTGGGRLILNPAPAPITTAETSAFDLGRFDLVVPNRSELAALAGAEETTDLATVADQARSLDVATVVVTLGGQGAMIVTEGGDVATVPAIPVNAVDTTAAGDSFCGALAVSLAEGSDVVTAVNWAVRVAAVTVTSRGAQASLPTRTEI